MRSLRVAPVLCTLRFGCLVDLLGGADFRVAGTASAAPPLAGDALEVKLECLEVLNDLLRRFAASLSEVESRDCLGALFGELPSSRAAARKRAIACIASLSASLPDRYAYQPRMRDVRAWISAVGQWLFRQCVCQMRFPYLDGISALGRQDPRRPAGWCYLWSNAYAWCQGRSASHVCAARHPSISIHDTLAIPRRFAMVTRLHASLLRSPPRLAGRYIQTLCAISRSGGYRLAKQLDKLIPMILQQFAPHHPRTICNITFHLSICPFAHARA